MTEFLPLILLFLFGGFAVVTALLKTRARVRTPLGVILTLLEGISGLVLMGTALPGAGSLATASWVAIAVAGLVAVSSTVHLLAVRERTQARERSEGKRLAAAIEYPVSDRPASADDAPDAIHDAPAHDALASIPDAPVLADDTSASADDAPTEPGQGSREQSEPPSEPQPD